MFIICYLAKYYNRTIYAKYAFIYKVNRYIRDLDR